MILTVQGECTDMANAAIKCEDIDCSRLFDDWSWLVPASHTPLIIGHFGDTVFAAPDGLHWLLSTLDGEYERIAKDSAEFNRLKGDPENVDIWFQWGWANIALQSGIVPPKMMSVWAGKSPQSLAGASAWKK
ncbi:MULTISPECIES: hypothetical protein [unclassified Mesorhizobium]|uniref:hypothetical protein n=1 Tax=unclassified Mesorhizobium TaxID=325217 RepID=UPI00333BC5FE